MLSKKLLLFLSVAFLNIFLLSSLHAQKELLTTLEKEKTSIEELSEVAAYYYLDHKPKKLVSLLKLVLTQSETSSEVKIPDSFLHFFATVAHNDPLFLTMLEGLKNQYLGNAKLHVINILGQTANFQSPTPKNPKDLDYLGSEFLATGEKEPLLKIIDVLSYPDEGENLILIAAAQWSLGANAKQHKRVYEIIKQAESSASGPAKEKLGKIVVALEDTYRKSLGRYGYKKEKYLDEQRERLEEAIAANPEDANNYLSRGIANANNLNYDLALADFLKALELKPNLPIANNYVCYIYLEKNDPSKAEEHCRKAIEQSPNFSKPHYNLARIYWQRKEFNKALASIAKTLEYEPSSFGAYTLRASIYREMGEREKAILDLEKALKLNPKNKEYLERQIKRLKWEMEYR